MRFPLKLTAKLTRYIARKRIRGEKMFPLVMMLEPLHACNLTCTGCGRIREYKSTISEMLTVEQCLAAMEESGAPVVSICGGEPTIYPELGRLVREILARGRHIYLCTNGMFIRKRLHEFKPTTSFFWNVHLDGLERTHDLCVERAVCFLLDHQNSDGSWDEHDFTGTGFPRVFYLKYHLYRLYFPLYALTRYRNMQESTPEFRAFSILPEQLESRNGSGGKR